MCLWARTDEKNTRWEWNREKRKKRVSLVFQTSSRSNYQFKLLAWAVRLEKVKPYLKVGRKAWKWLESPACLTYTEHVNESNYHPGVLRKRREVVWQSVWWGTLQSFSNPAGTCCEKEPCSHLLWLCCRWPSSWLCLHSARLRPPDTTSLDAAGAAAGSVGVRESDASDTGHSSPFLSNLQRWGEWAGQPDPSPKAAVFPENAPAPLAELWHGDTHAVHWNPRMDAVILKPFCVSLVPFVISFWTYSLYHSYCNSKSSIQLVPIMANTDDSQFNLRETNRSHIHTFFTAHYPRVPATSKTL